MKQQEKDFGVPVADNTPMGQVQMQGQLFRAMAKGRQRPLGIRIFIVIGTTILFILPALLFAFDSFTSLFSKTNPDRSIGDSLASIPFIILWLAVGLRIIYKNIVT